MLLPISIREIAKYIESGKTLLSIKENPIKKPIIDIKMLNKPSDTNKIYLLINGKAFIP